MVILWALGTLSHIGSTTLLRLRTPVSSFVFGTRARLGASHAIGTAREAIVVHFVEAIGTRGAVFNRYSLIVDFSTEVETSLASCACVDVSAATAVGIAWYAETHLEVPTVLTDCASLGIGAADAV